jgi:hypothetical protein
VNIAVRVTTLWIPICEYCFVFTAKWIPIFGYCCMDTAV